MTNTSAILENQKPLTMTPNFVIFSIVPKKFQFLPEAIKWNKILWMKWNVCCQTYSQTVGGMKPKKKDHKIKVKRLPTDI